MEGSPLLYAGALKKVKLFALCIGVFVYAP